MEHVHRAEAASMKARIRNTEARTLASCTTSYIFPSDMKIKSKSIISLPSVDPPRIKRDELVVPFLAHKRRLNKKQYKRMFTLPALEKLPRVLIPRPTRIVQPPLMHYGWVANLSALLEYADQHGLNVYVTEEDDDEEGVSWYDEVAEDSNDPEAESPSKARNATPRPPTLMRAVTVNAALYHMAKSFSQTVPVNLALRGVVYNRGTIVVGLYTNYDLYNAPSEAFVETLGEKLGQKDRPKWYIDSTRFQWSESVNDPPIDIIF